MDISGLLGALDSAQSLSRMVERDRGSHVQWTPPQVALHQCTARYKCLRTGNQFGKTWAGVKEIDWYCTGKHPYQRTKKPPIVAWILCASWKQSVEIQNKFYALCDHDEVEPKYLRMWNPENGFRHANPIVKYKNGSIVRFKTTEQGGKQLASATVHVILADEPPPHRAYNECQRRLTRTGGNMIITMTPINERVEYLKELCENGTIQDLHFRMEPRNFIPVGQTQPLRTESGVAMDAAWIESERASVLGYESAIILDGEWESRGDGAVFHRFNHMEHVTEALPRGADGATVPMEHMLFCLGFDHGSRDFKQKCIFGFIIPSDRLTGKHYSVHVLAEYNGDGNTLPEQDAAGALALLVPWEVTWSRDKVRGLHQVHGDHAHDAGRIRGAMGRKSNAELQAAVAVELGVSAGRVFPPIRRVKVGRSGGRGSVYRGCKWLHQAMLRPGHFTVHPSCKMLIDSLEQWDGADDEHKDACDALRYMTWGFAMKGHQSGTGKTKLYIPT